jgi:hypothetical protein
MGASPISCGSGSSSSSSSNSSNDNGNSNNGGNNTGSGGTFTGSDLNGTWRMSGCLPISGGPGDGGTYYNNMLNISGGNTWILEVFTYSSAACNTGVELANWYTAGTFTVGGVVSGSMQSIQFTVTSDTIQPIASSSASWFASNTTNAVALYGAPSTITAGYTYDLFYSNVTINGFQQPIPIAAYDVVNNVATHSANTLMLGAGVVTLPGVYSGSTTPSSVTVTYSGP